MKEFSFLLRLKYSKEMVWGPEQQEAFHQIKVALANPLVQIPPLPGRPLKLHIVVEDQAIDYLLAEDVDDGTERVIYYFSRIMNDAKIRYSSIEKLCLSLYHACTKLEFYLLPREILVLCKIDIVRYLTNRPILQGRLMKWAIKTNAFALTSYS